MISTVAIVPARFGSKGVMNKNIRSLGGIPLLAHTIRLATTTPCVERVLVSTEHRAIAEIAKEYGAEVIHRPMELATATALTDPVIQHAIDAGGVDQEVILTLEPTSPFRTRATIERCVSIFTKTDADSVIGVVENGRRSGQIIDNVFVYDAPQLASRRQDRPSRFEECGVIYGTRRSLLMDTGRLRGDRLAALVVNSREALDINDPWDFTLAELVYKHIQDN